jgi:hypothetical protein
MTNHHLVIWCILGAISGSMVMMLLISCCGSKYRAIKRSNNITYQDMIEILGITEQQGLDIISRTKNPLNFCLLMSISYGLELTLKQAKNIYNTAPLNE